MNRSTNEANRTSRLALVAFTTMVALVATFAIGFVAYTAAQRATVKITATDRAVQVAVVIDTAKPYVLYRHARAGDNGLGDVQRATLGSINANASAPGAIGVPDPADAPRALQCNRTYFAGGRGICLRSDFDGAWQSIVRVLRFDAAFNATELAQYVGIPSRARVSRDGTRGAFTLFVVGHSYASVGFSTQTMLGEFDDPSSWVSLETYQVFRPDGSLWREVDFNFWGVTFTNDSNVFYATLGSGGHVYLVQGDMATRQVRVLREGVECPSVSPDGTRLAFKHAVQPGFWSIHILNLATTSITMEETALNVEHRSVDDQIEWLDNDHLLYGLRAGQDAAAWDVWMLPADGQHPPTLFLANADSPAVVRP